MSSEIGYGAAAIRAGEVKYQQKLGDLMKQAATKKPANDDAASKPVAASKPADTQVGRNVDVKA